MAIETLLQLDLGADTSIVMTVEGAGDLTGTFRASIANRNNPSQPILTGTPTILDATARTVEWTLADTDTQDLREGRDYEFAIWRADSGSEAPLAYGRCVLRRLPGA